MLLHCQCLHTLLTFTHTSFNKTKGRKWKCAPLQSFSHKQEMETLHRHVTIYCFRLWQRCQKQNINILKKKIKNINVNKNKIKIQLIFTQEKVLLIEPFEFSTPSFVLLTLSGNSNLEGFANETFSYTNETPETSK